MLGVLKYSLVDKWPYLGTPWILFFRLFQSEHTYTIIDIEALMFLCKLDIKVLKLISSQLSSPSPVPSPSPKSKSQIQVPNPSPKSRSQIPKSKVQRKGTGTGSFLTWNVHLVMGKDYPWPSLTFLDHPWPSMTFHDLLWTSMTFYDLHDHLW